MGVITISDCLRKAFEQTGFVPYEIYQASAEEFYNAITVGKQVNVFGMFVDRHTIEDYERMDTLLIVDRTAGIAIERDGNIVSVFNGGKNKRVLRTLLPIAIDRGGIKLDNYNSSGLSALYEMYGFEPVSKVKFDPEYAPSDWNYGRDGQPDIVFWIHNGDKAWEVVQKFAQYPSVDWENLKEFDSYEEARIYRDSLLPNSDILQQV